VLGLPKDTSNTVRVLMEVLREREVQEAEGGQQNHPIAMWTVILSDALGRMSGAILEHKYLGTSEHCVRCELLNIAATAVAAVEQLDRLEEFNQNLTDTPIIP